MKGKCILGTGETVAAAVLWLLLPGCGIGLLYGVIGPDPRLLYLAAVVLLPGAATLTAPWLRLWLEARRSTTQRGGIIEKLARHRLRDIRQQIGGSTR